jgi:RecB family exonuclease
VIVTYLRSSSIGCYGLCPFQYFLQYELGIKAAPNPRTVVGTMAHKALELLARRKVAEQDGVGCFDEPELGVTLDAALVTPDLACSLAYEHYAHAPDGPVNHAWCEDDLATVRKHVASVLNHARGAFSPLNRTVLAPERYFDLEIDAPWAAFDRVDPASGRRLTGNLRVKGTVDLVTEATPDTLECLDWKTGSRKDWGKNTTKSHADLLNDPQMLLYFYALCRLYPQYKYVYLTVFFTKDGGPFTLPFDREADGPRAEALLRERFTAIAADERPRRVMDGPDRRRVCNGFCFYGKTPAPAREGGGSICEAVHRETMALGLDRVMARRGAKAHLAYSDGGGRTAREAT